MTRVFSVLALPWTLAVALVGLSAKPVTAQFPLEVGGTWGANVSVAHLALYGEGLAADARRHYGGLEHHVGMGLYVGSFPYIGWGWRAGLHAELRTEAGPRRFGLADLEYLHYLATDFTVYHVDDRWDAIGFGVSLSAPTDVHGAFRDPRTDKWYSRDRDVFAGLHAVSAFHEWGWTWELRLDLHATLPMGRLRDDVTPWTPDAPPLGRFFEWRLGPSARLYVPLNRQAWLRGQEGHPTIYQPRT